MVDKGSIIEQVRALVEELVERDPWDNSPSGRYEFCHYCTNARVIGTTGQHTDDCLWLRANTLLAALSAPAAEPPQEKE